MSREEANKLIMQACERTWNEKTCKEIFKALSQEPCDDAISRDFEIGDEVRMIGSDPIYDDCDVGWVIRNASEKVKTMYVMRNDGSADEENKAEWYKTGRHNAVIAEVIKALPSVTQKSGKWIKVKSGDKDFPESIVCSRCNNENSHLDFNENAEPIGKVFVTSKYCPNCGACMKEGRTLDEFIEDSKEREE